MIDQMDRAMMKMDEREREENMRELREIVEFDNLLWNTIYGPTPVPTGVESLTETEHRMLCGDPTPQEFASNH